MGRVAVTGMGGLTPLGNSGAEILTRLRSGESGIHRVDAWKNIEGVRTQLAGVVHAPELGQRFDRKKVRSMSHAALLGVGAYEQALHVAGLLGSPVLQSGSVGVAFGSCLGGAEALMQHALSTAEGDFRGIPATTYTKVLSHACAASISLFFGLRGRLLPTCSACTSGSQAISFAFETIQSGQQVAMIAGGADELCVALAALFESMNATSDWSGDPVEASRPFDRQRSGLVTAEGSAALVLEDWEHAEARGAKILAEVVGFGTNCTGTHITDPHIPSMSETLRLALRSTDISPTQIGYVHAHATGTLVGDLAEARAMREVLGEQTPVGALKSYLGHTLGAAGAIEAWLSIEMMREGWFAPIRNFSAPDQDLPALELIIGEGSEMAPQYVMSNNFAFGGVNTSLVFRRVAQSLGDL